MDFINCCTHEYQKKNVDVIYKKIITNASKSLIKIFC